MFWSDWFADRVPTMCYPGGSRNTTLISGASGAIDFLAA
jgi:hypothetical protein